MPNLVLIHVENLWMTLVDAAQVAATAMPVDGRRRELFPGG
jgi:hypothetical protein